MDYRLVSCPVNWARERAPLIDCLTQVSRFFHALLHAPETLSLMAVSLCTTGEDYVRAQPVQVVEFGPVNQAIAALADGKVAAIVHDQPTLKYAENNSPNAFE